MMLCSVLAFVTFSGCTENRPSAPTEPSITSTITPTETLAPTSTSTVAPTETATGTPNTTTQTPTTTKTPTIAPSTGTGTPKPTLAPTATPTKTPKKYFTLSLDDGTTQDERVIELLKKYNINCCTFFINTGRCGEKWTWVGESAGMPDVHTRFTEAQLRSGIYAGRDVAVHGLTHAYLPDYENNKSFVIKEVQEDANNIKDFIGVTPVGMAYAGGDPAYTDTVISYILEETNIRYARTALNTSSFRLPKCFMKWHPTCTLSTQMLDLAETFINAECKDDMLFYVWGHSYQLDLYDFWDEFEALLQMMSGADDVVLVNNTEFYELFKDQIPSAPVKK